MIVAITTEAKAVARDREEEGLRCRDAIADLSYTLLLTLHSLTNTAGDLPGANYTIFRGVEQSP
jgi:hypothetical protein